MYISYKDFDHTKADFADAGEAVAASLRSHAPLARSDLHGGFWILSRYNDVFDALRNTSCFSSARLSFIPRPPMPIKALPVEVDAPLHRAYRTILNPWFAAHRMEKLTPDIELYVHELIDVFALRGRCEFVSEFAEALPSIVTARAMGLDFAQARTFREPVIAMFDGMVKGDVLAQGDAIQAIIGLIETYIADAVTSPGDDLFSYLLSSKLDETSLPHHDILSIGVVLVIAAQETTSHALSNLLHRLAIDQALQAHLRAAPDLIEGAIEESLRLSTPTQTLGRTLACPFRLHGLQLEKDDQALLLLASANRDEMQFPDAARFEPTREPNRHLVT